MMTSDLMGEVPMCDPLSTSISTRWNMHWLKKMAAVIRGGRRVLHSQLRLKEIGNFFLLNVSFLRHEFVRGLS